MKLDNAFETETSEFKSTLSELDKGIISLTAMLNKYGKGTVYYGVINDGGILGLEGMLGQETVKKIGTVIFSNGFEENSFLRQFSLKCRKTA